MESIKDINTCGTETRCEMHGIDAGAQDWNTIVWDQEREGGRELD